MNKNIPIQKMSRRDFFSCLLQHIMGHIHRLFAKSDGAMKNMASSSQLIEKVLEPEGIRKEAILVKEQCLAWQGLDCQQCYLFCHLRDQAIRIEDRVPVVISSSCDGCGQCIVACESVNNTPALHMRKAKLSSAYSPTDIKTVEQSL